MKINSSIRILTAILCWLFISCSNTRNVSFNVTKPAEITLPADANTILLADRTKHAQKGWSTIEGILTGEMPGEDKAAAQEALISLKNRLNYSPRFDVKILPDQLVGNSLDGSLPHALDWNVVNNLCINNQADILVCIEMFDSDFIVTKGNRIKKKFVGEGADKKEVPYTEYYAQGVANVKMGIRTYYNKDRRIIDQQVVNKTNSWEGVGTSAADALRTLISKTNANKYLAGKVGDDYAYKISPMPIRISRPFFAKSKHNAALEAGTRYADVAQWQEAIDTWKSGLPNASSKDAGKLAYDIAVGYEVLGEYGTALTWAQDAYTKYGNKQARDYTRTLRNRINQETVLKQQMNN